MKCFNRFFAIPLALAAILTASCEKHGSFDGLVLKFSSSDAQTAFLESEETVLNVSTKLSIENGGSLKQALEYGLTVPSDAASLVEKYNEIHQTGYELLPSDAYSIGTGVWDPGKKSSSVPVTIFKSKTGDGIYLLPLRLSSDKVSLSTGVAYIAAGKNFYTNPVIMQSCSDPSIIRGEDGYFYLTGTEEGYFPPETQGMPVFKSDDMINWEWEDNRRIFSSRPEWSGSDSGNRGLWAPELRYINGKYVCYYSWVTGWGDSAFPYDDVGVAVSDTPYGPYQTQGKLIGATDFGVLPSIDPFYIEADGKKYLFWGSMPTGVYVTELNDDGLSVKRDSDGNPVLRQKVTAMNVEGVCIIKRGDWYYLLCSEGSTLSGAGSTYHVNMGRSRDILGPYLTKNGGRLLDGKFDVLVEGDGYFIGTGHNSVAIQDDAGQYWIAIHSYIASDLEMGHPLSMVQIFWDNNEWPYVPDNHIPRKALAPIVVKK